MELSISKTAEQCNTCNYKFIDSMRSIAILGVMLVHTAQWVPPKNQCLSLVCQNGSLGVQLFYVTSALTLMLSTSRRITSEKAAISNFYVRRVFRIAPLFWSGILVYGIALGPFDTYWAPNGISWLCIFVTAFFLNGWHPETISSVVPGGWSIAVEMTFYWVFPLVFAYCSNKKNTLWVLVFSLIICRGAMTGGPFMLRHLHVEIPEYLSLAFFSLWFFSQLPVFLCGVLLYHLLFGVDADKYGADGRLSLCLFAVGVAASLQLQTTNNLIPKPVVFGMLFILLGYGLKWSPYRILVNPFVSWVGKLSYSLYITHFLVIRLLSNSFYICPGDMGLILAFFAVLLASLLVSSITYRFIEIPGIAIGRNLIDVLEQRRSETR